VEPQNIRFGGGASDTILHPLVALALLVAVIYILVAPRKYVIVSTILMTFLVPFGQVVVLGGIHFTVYRIVIIFALVRSLMKRDLSPEEPRIAGGLNTVDHIFIFMAIASFVTFSLQWMDSQALVKELGTLLDVLGGYLVVRSFIRDREDVERSIKMLGYVAIILAVCMINEQLTHENIFGRLGGVDTMVAMREGKARSTAVFEVYLTAGVFGATLLPLFIWLWSESKHKVLAGCSILGATAMTITSNSSTPLLAYVAGIAGLCFWPFRQRMRVFRLGLVISLVVLHLIMKAPVWALVSRVDLTGSSSGYHRYMLLDGCIRHFSDWWLIGFKNYNDWGWDMWDLSNQYVAYALTGGLITLVAFILVISRSFGRLGNARKIADTEGRSEWYVWCFGAALVAHVVAYFGIGYFDQMQFAWYILLGLIAVVTGEYLQQAAVDPEKSLMSAHSHEIGMSWNI
jgi:hypothetical protein